MSKKKVIGLTASALALTTMLASCGTPVEDGPKIDPTKTQIYVSAWNGGFGVEWLNQAAATFNEKNSEVQVIINPNKDAYTTGIKPGIQAGTSTNDIYITPTTYCVDLGIQGYLEDLSDVWEADPEGDGTTIEQDIIDAEQFKGAYSSKGKVYALPHNEAIQGFVYDHSIFVEKGYLMTEADGITLTAGKDGKVGTYDDGQPTTIAEWDMMIQRMVSDGVYPFFWNGMYATDYLMSLQEALLAQYIGMDSYLTTWSYDGEYTYADGTKETITPATGYKLTKLPEKKVVIDWMEKYLCSNPNYYHPSSKYTSVSHTDAEALFVLGYENTTSNPQSAMLYEGVWWENETRATFVSLANRGAVEYKYGTRDYRYMLLPAMDGQRGANGDGTGSVISVSENGNIFLKKQSDETKRTYAKEFIKYIVSDEVSKAFTTQTGGLRPYKYELGENELSQMTVFAKNAYALYSDAENVSYIRVGPLEYSCEMNYLTNPVVRRWGSKVGGREFMRVYDGLQNHSAADFYAGMDSFATESYWKPIYDKYLAL